MWGRLVHSGREDALRRDLWLRRPRLERKTLCWSQQLAPLWFDTCPALWQNLQSGWSPDMCTVQASAREPGAEKPKQQPERPVEATEYPLLGGYSGRMQQSGASWSRGLGVQAPPEAISFNSTGKSSSYCWNYHIVLLTCAHKLKLTQRHACTLSVQS